MTDADREALTTWLTERGLDGASETELLDGFCERCKQVGLPLSRAMALVDTLHPIYEGRAFRWRGDGVEESSVVEYGPTSEGAAATNWQRSAFYYMWTTGTDHVRRRLTQDDQIDFLHLENLRADGETDYVAFSQQFASDGRIGELDCVYANFTTRRPEGFADAEIAALRRLMPPLSLALKCASLTRIAGTLVEVYLGRDAGQRVLSGRMSRGVADRIHAVLWFSDLRGYTGISVSPADGSGITPTVAGFRPPSAYCPPVPPRLAHTRGAAPRINP